MCIRDRSCTVVDKSKYCCINCGKAHAANSSSCPVYKEELLKQKPMRSLPKPRQPVAQPRAQKKPNVQAQPKPKAPPAQREPSPAPPPAAKPTKAQKRSASPSAAETSPVANLSLIHI